LGNALIDGVVPRQGPTNSPSPAARWAA
jgi:hypothetical protein